MHGQSADAIAVLDQAMRSRQSVRAFRPDPDPRSLLVEILDAARTAASNYNSQPWRVHVLTGKAKREFGEALLREHTAAGASTFSPSGPHAAGLRGASRRFWPTLLRCAWHRSHRQSGALPADRPQLCIFDAPVGRSRSIAGSIAASSCRTSSSPRMFAAWRRVRRSRSCATSRSWPNNWDSPPTSW